MVNQYLGEGMASRSRSEWIVRFTPWVSVSGFFTNGRNHERRFPCARWSRWHGSFPRSPKHGDSGSQSRTESEFYNTSCGSKCLTILFAKEGQPHYRLDHNRQLINHYASLSGTYRNCAGGPTPWGSWITCEENVSTLATNRPGNATNVSKSHGYNFEVPALATVPVNPVPLVAMGRFNHEAVAIDPKTGIVYETEDQRDSLLYRFIPSQPNNLSAGGTLQALKIKNMPQAKTFAGFPKGQPMPVEWVTIDNPDPATDTVRVEGFGKGAAQFARGEGIWYGNREVYFCCTNGGSVDANGRPNGFGQVWRYLPDRDTIELFVEAKSADELDGPDNIVVAPYGDLIICEDGNDEQFVVGVTPNGELYRLAKNAINDSEFAGACFSPDGRTMFVNIQTPGITFAIWGPWKSQRGA